jgi:hypothetical protein
LWCYSAFRMPAANQFCALEVSSLAWPSGQQIPSKRFRLFVAADTTRSTPEALAEFARAALMQGMVYLCAWGPGCERFHDIVDEIIVEDLTAGHLVPGPNASDTIMTTWHANETLDEALDYFLVFASPTDRFAIGGEYWLALSVSNSNWAARVKQRLEHQGLTETES